MTDAHALFESLFPRDETERQTTLDDLRKRTQFPRTPVEYRALCDRFVQLTGWRLDPKTRQIVAAGARDFYTVHGCDCDLLEQAMLMMQRQQLVVASPRSCITHARTIKERGLRNSDADRRRYVEGEYADFIEH